MRPRDIARYRRDLGWTDPPLAAPPADAAPAAFAATACASLDDLAATLQGCTRCRLSEGRHRVVVGEGSGEAGLLFVGEGPGAEEDRTGRPFVGPAGQLLDAMIRAIGLERRQTYIANVVKCRPPRNRNPEPDEIAACADYLDRQIELLAPRVIVALGRPAAQRLTGTSKPISALRGTWAVYRGIPVLPTFHPAYLLRSPAEKRAAWDDFKAVRRRLSACASDEPGVW